jgi:hypothetical protein
VGEEVIILQIEAWEVRSGLPVALQLIIMELEENPWLIQTSRTKYFWVVVAAQVTVTIYLDSIL